MLRNKRGHDSERPAHRDEEWPPLAATRESPRTETKTQHSHKLINLKKKQKLKVELPYDPAIPLPGIYPEKTMIQKDTRTPMFTAALFTIARTWKQPKYPLTDEWIKMWYIYTMEYYSTIKRNEIGSFVEIWMDLESVIQSEVSQKEKNKYCILMHICGI